MASGDRIPGRRLKSFPVRGDNGFIPKPGDYYYGPNPDGIMVLWIRLPIPDVTWGRVLPVVAHPSMPGGWAVTDHGETISVAPSIHAIDVWHGYLIEGIWVEA